MTDVNTMVERLETILSDFDTEVAEHIDNETERADLWDEVDIPVMFLREIVALIRTQQEALKPFASVGRLIDGPFGPALFKQDDEAFKSGCAWIENGERKTLTWGDFRRARAAGRGEG